LWEIRESRVLKEFRGGTEAPPEVEEAAWDDDWGVECG
jgi:hypothetical protein